MKLTPLTKSQITIVIERWNNGESARIIGAAYGKSRNAIIGYVHRHGGKDRRRDVAASIRAMPNRQPRQFQKIEKVKPLPIAPVILDEPIFIGPVDDVAADGCCQYMHGDITTKGWRMCGHPVRKRRSSWCEIHWMQFVRNPNQPVKRLNQPADASMRKVDGRVGNGKRLIGNRVAAGDGFTEAFSAAASSGTVREMLNS